MTELTADLQVSFYYRLKEMRTCYLQEALSATIENIDIPEIDSELKDCVDIHPE